MAYGCTEEYSRGPQWLVRHLKLWMNRTGLDRTWVVVMHFQDRVTVDGTRCKAVIDWAEGYQTADLYIAKWFYDEADGPTMDHLLLHELDHLILARVEDTLKEHIGPDTVVHKAYTKEAERAGDVFAKILIRAYARKADRA